MKYQIIWLGPFLFPKTFLYPAHLLMELLMMTNLGWFCCKMSRFLVSDMEGCCILSRSDWLQECKWLSFGLFFPWVLVAFATLLLCSSPFPSGNFLFLILTVSVGFFLLKVLGTLCPDLEVGIFHLSMSSSSSSSSSLSSLVSLNFIISSSSSCYSSISCAWQCTRRFSA